MPRDLKLTPTTSRISRWGWPHGETSIDDAVAVLCGAAVARTVYVLGIDQAASSGWAVADPLGGRILRSGVVHGVGTHKGTHDMVAMLEQLRALPAFDWSRVLVVFEDHGTIAGDYRQRFDPATGERPDRNPRVPLGLGHARGEWSALLNLRGHPTSQRLLASPTEWRVVYKGLRMPGDDPKATAMRWASAMTGRRVDHPDEADAMGLAVWGSVTGLHRFAEDRLRKRAAAAARNATRARSTDEGTPA